MDHSYLYMTWTFTSFSKTPDLSDDMHRYTEIPLTAGWLKCGNVCTTYQPVGNAMKFSPFKRSASIKSGFYRWPWLKGVCLLHRNFCSMNIFLRFSAIYLLLHAKGHWTSCTNNCRPIKYLTWYLLHIFDNVQTFLLTFTWKRPLN